MRKGFTLVYAVIVVAIVVMLVLGFTQFRSMVTHATELTAQEVNAQAAAEAGLVAAMAELQANLNFFTHERATVTNEAQLASDPLATPKLQFNNPLRQTSRVNATIDRFPGLAAVSVTNPGDYTFEIGRGMSSKIGRGFEGTFRVKIAPILLTGYPRPLIAVESRGKFDQRVMSLVTFLEAGGGQPQNPGGGTVSLNLGPPSFSSLLTEFVIADGEFVDLGMGSPNDPNNENVFSIGRLYGSQAVHIANIEGNGTRQSFKRFGGFQSGGFVWFADQYNMTFWDASRPDETMQPPLTVQGSERPEADRPPPDLFTSSNGRIVDFRHNGKLAMPDVTTAMDRVVADTSIPNVIDLSRVPQSQPPFDDSDQYDGKAYVRNLSNYQNPYDQGGSAVGETIEINFGAPAYLEGVTGDTDPIPYTNVDPHPELAANHPARAAQPANLLWCRGKNVVVWGCPDRDVAIYTDKDIYVAGDFNQSPWHHQIYTSQEPNAQAAITNDGREARYVDPVRFAIDQQMEASNPEASREGSTGGGVRLDQTANQNIFQERKLTRLTAKSRIWFDYRYPSRFMANELIPWIEYQLAAHLLTDPASNQAPTAQAQQAAVGAVRYGSNGDWSRKDKATTINVSGQLFALKDAGGQPTGIAQHFMREVLKLDPAATEPAVRTGADAAKNVLLAELGTSPTAQKIHPTARALFYKVLCPTEKRTRAGGIWMMPEHYYETVFVHSPSAQNLNQHQAPFNAGGNPNLLRLYVPEMTINSVMTDGAIRHGDWDKNNPRADKKIYNEIGNANATGTYLRFKDGSGGRMNASPGIGRVYGTLTHLRQNPPNPNLFTQAGIAYIPLKRKRIYARSQGRFMGLALAFGPGGDGGLPNSFRVVARRESALAAERGAADQLIANWP